MGRAAFQGYPAYLERAAELAGLAPAIAGGAPPAPLAALANLCAQASTAEAGHVPEILRQAAALRDRLVVAAKAAELMIEDVSPRAARPDPKERPRAARPPTRRSPSRT